MTALPRPIVYMAAGSASKQVLDMLEGRNVLESFASTCPHFDRYRPTWAHSMLDSGAYGEMTTGNAIDLGAYIEFCQEHGAFYDSVVNLDDIRGDVAKSQRNHRAMLDAGIKAMPVFHQGEAWSVLDETIAAAPESYIGIGFQRPIQNARAWLDEVFSRIPSGVRVHGFAMTAHVPDGYPFFSVDSATWLWEWKALMSVKGQGADALEYLTPRESLEIVAKKYDRLAPRGAWRGKAQGDLFGDLT